MRSKKANIETVTPKEIERALRGPLVTLEKRYSALEKLLRQTMKQTGGMGGYQKGTDHFTRLARG